MSQEWCTSQDLFFLYCILSGRPCNLARCLAEYFSTYYHRQERGLIFGGVYVTRIARFNGLIDMEPAGMEAFHPVRLDRRTVLGMHIAQTFPRVGLRFSLQRGVIWQPGPNDLHYRDEDHMPVFPKPQPQPQPQQQPQQPPPPPRPPPHGEGEPHQDVPHQHPERIYRAVRLPARVEAMIQGIADSTQQLIQQHEHMQQQLELMQHLLQIQQQQTQILQQQAEQRHTSEQMTRRLDRLEDLISWHVHVELRHAEGEGIQLPAVPRPRDYPPPPPPPPPP
ncbi:hypothetical protein E3N88_37630 [Mikania micrantha]|uniref:Uncharacterized protein n=1 Tax=Mikania micrantha TaxID=192012 RepID=A0A5N6LRQ8_9ASTR|nr:hypothetical protein E3N88_37630 [Mikania micrantha]